MLSDPNGIADFFNAITPAISEDKRQEAIKQLREEGIKVDD